MSNILETLQATVANDGKITTEAALSLMLAAQLEMLERVEKIETLMGPLSGRLKRLEVYQEQYPPLLFLIRHKPKTTIFWLGLLWLAMAFLFIKESREFIGDVIQRVAGF